MAVGTCFGSRYRCGQPGGRYREVKIRVNVWTARGTKKCARCREVAFSGGSTVFNESKTCDICNSTEDLTLPRSVTSQLLGNQYFYLP